MADPQRLGWAGAGAGLGEGLSNIGQLLITEAIRNRNGQRALQTQLTKDYSDRVAKGDMDPDQAERALNLAGVAVPKGYFDAVQPSVPNRLQAALKPLSDAKTVAEVPSTDDITTGLQAKRVPLLNTPQQAPEGGFSAYGPGYSDPALKAYGARENKLNAFPPVPVESYDPALGATVKDLIPARDYTGGGGPVRRQITPTPLQAGVNAGTTAVAKESTENENGLPEMIGSAFNRTTQAELPGLTAKTTAETTASHAAALPFEEALAKFHQSLTDESGSFQVMNDPASGTDKLFFVQKPPKGGQPTVTPIAMPAGYENYQAGKSRQLPATVADNLASTNAAELESVKILQMLRKTGLSNDNEPLSPRWNQFVQNTLKISPDDPYVQAMQQRVGFVNAIMTRALMGSRPSQYVAQFIIQPHLPKQDMTGKLLDQTIRDVLEEANLRRAQFSGTYNVPQSRLAPVVPEGSGLMTYDQYQKTLGTPAGPGTATLTLDAQGNLVPIVRQQ